MKNGIPFCRCLTACAGATLVLAAIQTAAVAGLPNCPDGEFLFSLDIGSDTELSDPFLDGDEVFDPGDAYDQTFAPALPANGIVDDALFFGADPPPDPFAAGSAAPTCTGAAIGQIIDEYFDMDGLDLMDFQLDLPPDVPLSAPIPCPGSPCVFPAEKLFLSWDDDVAAHYADPGCPVPVASPSPFVGGTFGTTIGKDEIFSITVTTAVPTVVGPFVSELDERGVNAALLPNPDTAEENDDDVDALDIVLSPAQQLTICPFVYWSPDHEAKLGLDSGDIYLSFLFGPAGLIPVVDDVSHLGIPDSTDVDAFEFVCVEFTGAPGLYLALLFSVDDDDPLTPLDESGGLFPDVIYISYFMGVSFPFTPPLGEDIDAITNWCDDFVQTGGACCFCDGTCADVPTAADCAAIGGIYQGDGTACAAVTCEEFGACCLCDGTCIPDLTLADCTSATVGGKWQGPCVPCTAALCEPTGACCLCDGTCIDMVTLAVCEDPLALNGKYQGDCTTCAAGLCEPTGACCLCDGTCIDMVTQAVCEDPLALNGKYMGDCVTCAEILCIPYGACCLPDGTCVDMLTAAECTGAAFGGIYQGDCTDCANVDCNPTEACCFCDGTCLDLLPADCLIQGGKPQGPGTACPTAQCEPFGACCLPDGTCVDMLSLLVCEGPLFGGTYQGDCTDCATVNCDANGACCFACETYPGGPPLACITTDRDTCCSLQGLFVPGGDCSTISCTQRVCPCDLDGDNDCDVFDFGIFAGNFGSCIPAIFGRCDGDLNCDGCIDVFDFGLFSSGFGCSLPPIPNQCCSGP